MLLKNFFVRVHISFFDSWRSFDLHLRVFLRISSTNSHFNFFFFIMFESWSDWKRCLETMTFRHIRFFNGHWNDVHSIYTLKLNHMCIVMVKPLAYVNIFKFFSTDKSFWLIFFMRKSKNSEFHGKINKILIAFKNTAQTIENNKYFVQWKNAVNISLYVDIKAIEFDMVSPKLFAIHIVCPNGMMNCFSIIYCGCVLFSLCYLLSNYILHITENSGHSMIVCEGRPSDGGSTNSSNYHNSPLMIATFGKKKCGERNLLQRMAIKWNKKPNSNNNDKDRKNNVWNITDMSNKHKPESSRNISIRWW